MPLPLKLLFTLLGLAAAAYIAISVLLYFQQTRMILAQPLRRFGFRWG
jgi:hypothetical protein